MTARFPVITKYARSQTAPTVRRRKGMKTSRTTLLCLAAAVPLAAGFIQRNGSSTTATTAKVVSAANAFLDTLSQAEKTKVSFAFNSSQRTGWSNLPTGVFKRNGLRLGDLTQQQRSAALPLVASALNRDGYQKVINIMNGDEVLKNAGGGQTGGRQGGPGRGGRGGGVQFGLDEYYIALLGAPSAASPWMIQFG